MFESCFLGQFYDYCLTLINFNLIKVIKHNHYTTNFMDFKNISHLRAKGPEASPIAKTTVQKVLGIDQTQRIKPRLSFL